MKHAQRILKKGSFHYILNLCIFKYIFAGRLITLTEKHCYVVSIFNNFGQDPGINFLDPIWEIHRFETGEEVQYVLLIHKIACKILTNKILEQSSVFVFQR